MRSRRTRIRERRALTDLDEKPGMGDDFWAERKWKAEERMAVIDAAPEPWRDLVNTYNPNVVAELAGEGCTPAQALACCRRRYGDPI